MRLACCQVCKKRFLIAGYKNHVINSAKAEAYRKMKDMLDYAKHQNITASSSVVLRNMPHLAFYRRNLKNKKIFKI